MLSFFSKKRAGAPFGGESLKSGAAVAVEPASPQGAGTHAAGNPASGRAGYLDRIAQLVPTLEGWCSVEKAHHIARTLVETSCQNYVEIGVFGGRSLLAAAAAFAHLKRGDAFGVDPWTNAAAIEGDVGPENTTWWSQIDLEKIYRGFVAGVLAHQLTPYCRWLRATSETAVRLFDDASLDCIYIDGSHSEQASTRDTQLWLPKVKPGGLIFFDDFDWNTTLAARQWLGLRCELEFTDGQYGLFRKQREAAA